uniref:Secreted protein n=1 Tax=Bactrocera latifrons TaxID=174628 RepID=A0A0K8UX08_BACLA
MFIINLHLICGFLVLMSICQVMPVDGAIDDYGPMINDAKDSVQNFKHINHADSKNDDNYENDDYDYEDDDGDEDDDSDGRNNGNKDDSDEEGGAQKGGDSERSDKSGSKR